MLIQDSRLMKERMYATAVVRYMQGNKADAIETLRRGFPNDDISGHIQKALGKVHSQKRGTP